MAPTDAVLRALALGVSVALSAAHGGAPGSQLQAFRIAGQSVPPGQRVDLDIPVSAGATDPATIVPTAVFHGTSPGPVLALTAGVHGYECPPILAAQRLLARIDPRYLRGTVILVRLAHVRRSDLHVELHSGDGAEWLEAFVGIYGGRLAEAQFARSRDIGLAFGIQNVVTYGMDTQAQVDSSRSLNRQAVADGKPTVLVEIGENGRRDEAFVQPIVDGVENLLRVLQMLPGAPRPPRGDTRWFEGTTEATATTTGILTPVSMTARFVKKGELLARVTDFAGRERERVVSPVDGYAMYGLAGPPVRAGEAVVTIGLPATRVP